jgi:hypothetical protein
MIKINVFFYFLALTVGMVKQPVESGEFTMSHEDFPALPGAAPASAGGGGGALTSAGQSLVDQQASLGGDPMSSQSLLQVRELFKNLGQGRLKLPLVFPGLGQTRSFLFSVIFCVRRTRVWALERRCLMQRRQRQPERVG